MNKIVFNNISKIIERESKTTTYKFALLRGIIDIIQENSPFISFSADRVHLPIGLLIEKWMLYYYPILESSIRIPQINGELNLAFEELFQNIISKYSNSGGFSVFYNDLKNKNLPQHIESDFIKLAKKIKDTIIKQPMKYIGSSINNSHYSIFQLESKTTIKNYDFVNTEFLIENFGSFSIPVDYYEAFKILGSFINGKDSILFKWAEFSVNASSDNLKIEKVVNEILKNPITKREVDESKKIYEDILIRSGDVYCVWTGKRISAYDIDHVIPFSVWKNNDLWNLLPSQKRINIKKGDKIPSASMIERQKELVLYYWDVINEFQNERFQREIKISLLGNEPFNDWKEKAIVQLKSICDYLIKTRGYEEWKI